MCVRVGVCMHACAYLCVRALCCCAHRIPLQLRERSRQAAMANSTLDPEQLYRDRLEFAQKIHGEKHKQTYVAMWNLAQHLFEKDLVNAEALALVDICRRAWAENPKFASPDKAKMAGKQLVKMWEAIGGDENILKASEMRDQCGMKQVIVQVGRHGRGGRGRGGGRRKHSVAGGA